MSFATTSERKRRREMLIKQEDDEPERLPLRRARSDDTTWNTHPPIMVTSNSGTDPVVVEANQQEEEEGGPVENIGTLLQKLLVSNETIVEVALRALCKLSLHTRAGWEEAVKTMVCAGGCLSVVHAMRRFPMNAAIQERACKALLCLSYKNEDSKKAIVQVGGVEAIANAMTDFPQNDVFQGWACGVFQNLASCEATAAKITASEIALVIAAMENHKHDVYTLQTGCRCFQNLARHSEGSKRLIYRQGGISAVAKCLETHPDNAELQEVGWKTMEALKCSWRT